MAWLSLDTFKIEFYISAFIFIMFVVYRLYYFFFSAVDHKVPATATASQSPPPTTFDVNDKGMFLTRMCQMCFQGKGSQVLNKSHAPYFKLQISEFILFFFNINLE